jgi:hypothetical protein
VVIFIVEEIVRVGRMGLTWDAERQIADRRAA